jgi:oxygen-independent coproporphyrinogen-3 oxidase
LTLTAPTDPLTGLPAARKGVYVHFPYCLSKCPYCDFASTVAKQLPQERYTRAVLAELALRTDAAEPEAAADSVFFGGGTPSLWDPRHVGEVLDAIARRVGIAAGAEITLEANPGASDEARFAGYRAAGVNRLSIGVQSFQQKTLTALGRAHDPQTAERAFHTARAAGFDQVSLDFIYGVHGQTLAEAREDAHRAAALGPDHLSAYALTLDRESLAEEVPLAKRLARGEVHLPPDEAVVEMGQAVREAFTAAGLARYEISNVARLGAHSKHNALYWTGGAYLAVGVGATGYAPPGDEGSPQGVGRRYSNLRSAEKYLVAVEEGRLPEAGVEPLGRRERFAERLAMGLRLACGVELLATCARYGEDTAPRVAEAERLAAHGLARFDGSRLSLTDRGLDLHSAIAARLI